MTARLDSDFLSFLSYYDGLHRHQADRSAWTGEYCRGLPPIKNAILTREERRSSDNKAQIARDMLELSELVALSHFSTDMDRSLFNASWNETWQTELERSETDNSISTDSEFVRIAYSRNSKAAEQFVASSTSSSRHSPVRSKEEGHREQQKHPNKSSPDTNSSDVSTDNNISSESDFVELAFKRNSNQPSVFVVSSVTSNESSLKTDEKPNKKSRPKSGKAAIEEFSDFVDRVFHRNKTKVGSSGEDSVPNTGDLVSEFNSVESLKTDNAVLPETESSEKTDDVKHNKLESCPCPSAKAESPTQKTEKSSDDQLKDETTLHSSEDSTERQPDSNSHIESIEKSRELSNTEFIEMINKKYNLSSSEDSKSEKSGEEEEEEEEKEPASVSDESERLPRQAPELTWSKWKLALLDDENDLELKPRTRTELEKQINERIRSSSKLSVNSSENYDPDNFNKTTSLPNISFTEKLIPKEDGNTAGETSSKWNAITDELTKIKSSFSASLANGFNSLLSLGEESEPEIQTPSASRKRFESAQETCRRQRRIHGQPRSSSCAPRTNTYNRKWVNLFDETA